ncbi:hypothetical protein IWQ60_010679 [Tieghemiomyces parasiticus]|uniref:Uncharacterized protein n=1 Tax=Tieghemiomyces parasiticus TaxID=78921 RepID=A0A9W7ZKH4_9FUNG|nr:hypothetical protein IWQ60_010679 [Tieghemiomyces parasiticus]
MVPAPPTTQTPMSEEDLVDLGVHRLDARRPGQAQLQKFLHWYVGWLRTLHTAGPEEQRESLAARLHDGEVHNGTTGVMDHQLPGSGILDVLLHRNPMCQWVADTCLAV